MLDEVFITQAEFDAKVVQLKREILKL